MLDTETQKVTIHLPKALLKNAQAETGKGITETVKEGLKMLERKQAYEALLKMRGKVKFSINIDELREDKKRW